jgi:hypothetical protein
METILSLSDFAKLDRRLLSRAKSFFIPAEAVLLVGTCEVAEDLDSRSSRGLTSSNSGSIRLPSVYFLHYL